MRPIESRHALLSPVDLIRVLADLVPAREPTRWTHTWRSMKVWLMGYHRYVLRQRQLYNKILNTTIPTNSFLGQVHSDHTYSKKIHSLKAVLSNWSKRKRKKREIKTKSQEKKKELIKRTKSRPGRKHVHS